MPNHQQVPGAKSLRFGAIVDLVFVVHYFCSQWRIILLMCVVLLYTRLTDARALVTLWTGWVAVLYLQPTH